jgi:hypothetical protein
MDGAIVTAEAADDVVFSDHPGFGHIGQALDGLIESEDSLMGELRSATKLSLELMDQGSRKIGAGDEGLMARDTEECPGGCHEGHQKVRPSRERKDRVAHGAAPTRPHGLHRRSGTQDAPNALRESPAVIDCTAGRLPSPSEPRADRPHTNFTRLPEGHDRIAGERLLAQPGQNVDARAEIGRLDSHHVPQILDFPYGHRPGTARTTTRRITGPFRVSHRRVGQGHEFSWDPQTDQTPICTLRLYKPKNDDRSPTRISVGSAHPTSL